MQMKLQSLKISAAAREFFDSEMFYYFFDKFLFVSFCFTRSTTTQTTIREKMFTSLFNARWKANEVLGKEKNRHDFTFGCKMLCGEKFRREDERCERVQVKHLES